MAGSAGEYKSKRSRIIIVKILKHGTPLEVLGPQQESPRQMQLVLHKKVIIVINVKEKQIIRPL
jgi:hypothetical protein